MAVMETEEKSHFRLPNDGLGDGVHRSHRGCFLPWMVVLGVKTFWFRTREEARREWSVQSVNRPRVKPWAGNNNPVSRCWKYLKFRDEWGKNRSLYMTLASGKRLRIEL
jgi:hypothetical protein